MSLVVGRHAEYPELLQICRGDEYGTAPEEDGWVELDWVDDGEPGWSDDLPADLPAKTLP